MYKIKFGTDGWREIIADNFTTANVRRVAYATALWLKKSGLPQRVVVGHDCRFGGNMFARETATILADQGIEVILAEEFVSTPMISLAAVKLNAGLGIIITASHNPPEYSGFKIKAHYGGPATPAVVAEIENLIPDQDIVSNSHFNAMMESGNIKTGDFEVMYIDHVKNSFDMEALGKISSHLAYDAMYGAGQRVIKSIFPNATLFHANPNPGFEGRAPEPILKNLPEISAAIAANKDLWCGLATDGDADRIGFFDEHGDFVDSHKLILLIIQYLTEHKGFTGKVVKSFSVGDRIQILCDKKGLESITTKIGFKYICELMVTDDVLIGAEESGGIAIKGHIPERDGIWMGLVIMEYMAKTGKSISELLSDIYAQTGTFAMERYDLHLTEEKKQEIVGNCKNNAYSHFGEYAVQGVEDTDGFKFRFGNGEWVMIRPSGTEPVLRVYAEAANSAAAFKILDTVKTSIL